jgi:transposase
MTDVNAPKNQFLKANGTLNPQARRVHDALFHEVPFFDSRDLLQVKYEMLRRVRIDGWPVSRAAAAFGLSRPAFYQAQHAFEHHGLSGLLPRKRGPKAGRKLTAEVMGFVHALLAEAPELSAQTLARRIAERFAVSVHPRSIKRALSPAARKKGV